ncbi:hypothetical protein ACIRST_25455 [Kitasatospora sp. NPDC101447]|uniref:hypothetical protein n=1 Tax=Kitasatospora sp. NPDC101447 TaxID=3364102 RepID=UPI0037FE786F
MDTAVPDLRMHTVVPDYAAMHALVADLVLPEGAPMSVTSALDTSRELVRHSYFRYEFATVAVAHALLALEQVLAERTGHHGGHDSAGADDSTCATAPLRELVRRAGEAGLLPADPDGELEHAVRLRERIARGEASSAALYPPRAVVLLRAVFDAVALALRPVAPAPAGPGPGGHLEHLARQWQEYTRAPFPASFRGVDVDGADLVLLDVYVAGLVHRELNGGLDDDGIAVLWQCIADLSRVVPLIDEAYCAAYFARLRDVARLAAARHLPPAT